MTRPWPAADIAPYIALIDDPSHRVRDDGTYLLSETQARAILDLRLQRLTALGVKEVTDELEKLAGRITDYLDILRSRARIMAIIADELREVRELFAVPRRSEIVEWDADLDDEDLIEREDMVVTVTQGGYIKRTPLTEYRAQRRGGKGTAGMATKDEDFVTRLFVANTHTALLFFTTEGMVYTLKTWRLPLGGRNARGKAIVNILPIPQGVSVAAIMPVDVPEEEWASLQIMFATSDGDVRRNALDDFTNVMRNGKIAMKLPEGVRLINARICSEDDDVMLTTTGGRAIRFPVPDVRVFKGRDSTGVRGIRLGPGDEVVSMAVIRHFEATPGGARGLPQDAPRRRRRARGGGRGRRGARRSPRAASSSARRATSRCPRPRTCCSPSPSTAPASSRPRHDYPVRGRGGQGVTAMDRAMRGGPLVTLFPVEQDDQIMLATDAGQSIRVPVAGISFRSRRAGGVRVFNTGAGRARGLGGADRRERRGGGGLTGRLRVGLVGLGMAVTPHAARAHGPRRTRSRSPPPSARRAARRASFAAALPVPARRHVSRRSSTIRAVERGDDPDAAEHPRRAGRRALRRRRQARAAREAAGGRDRPRRGAGRGRGGGRGHARRRAAAPLPPGRGAAGGAARRGRLGAHRRLLDDDPAVAAAVLLRRARARHAARATAAAC